MKLAEYPAYRSSQIEWVKNVPIDWEECSAKINYVMQLGKMLQNDPAGLEDVEINYLKALHVNWNQVTTDALPKMWASPSDLKQYAVLNGDLLVCEGGEVGRAAIIKELEEPAIIQNALHRVTSTQRGNVRYFCYLLKHIADAGWFTILCNKATIAHLTSEKLGAICMPVPSGLEQKQIAAFLDWKTGQIDALIAKKKQLIEKLREQRIAVITQAVTKGLNPNTPMRDSGIPWLGQVPKHWEVKRLKFYTERIFTGSTPPSAEVQYYEDPSLDWYTPSDFSKKGGMLANARRKLNPAAVEDGMVRIFDRCCVLIVGIGATLGRVGIAEPSFACNQQINVVIPNVKVDPKFLFYSLSVKEKTMKVISNASTLGIMNQETTRQIQISAPDINEQREITAFLDREVTKLDELFNKLGAAIHRLTEYRTALITAATTGKIDVRGINIRPLFP